MPTRSSRSAPRQFDVPTIRSLLLSGEGGRALLQIGDRWSFLILRDAFLGVRRFEDFKRLGGAPRATLTSRLGALVESGILYRAPYGRSPGRLEYRLTEKGLALYPVALCLWAWETRWAGEFGLPPRLVHTRCGANLAPQLTCMACDRPVVARDVQFEPGPGASHEAAALQGRRRRDRADAAPAAGVDTTLFHSCDTIGDRWTALLVAALFFGLHRYDDINAALDISTNILADRLRRLLSAGVIEQRLYEERPPRHAYRLTAKGWDFFPFIVALHTWGSAWMPTPRGPGLILRHRPCGHRLRGRASCSHCGEAVTPQDVTVRGSRGWQARRRGPGPATRAAKASR
jgi:DNA-binding HxlR family transcriptional regulator